MDIAAHAENMKLLRLIREEPAWALSRVKRVAELETEVERLRDLCGRAVDALRYEANPVCDEWDDWLVTHPGGQS